MGVERRFPGGSAHAFAGRPGGGGRRRLRRDRPGARRLWGNGRDDGLRFDRDDAAAAVLRLALEPALDAALDLRRAGLPEFIAEPYRKGWRRAVDVLLSALT